MQTRILRVVAGLALVASCSGVGALAQKTGTLSGVIKDSQTGDVLPGANVLLVGTGMGATSDIAGKYVVRSVPAGTYQVRVTYVGYTTSNSSLTVEEGRDVKKDFKLVPVAIEGETVVVTAQAAGQNEAINQQLTSMPVMNVVSAARIQELPDANAAESVGRLPGVSLVRTGGEGAQVVIRGLSPQYNQVTIDGVEMPSDVPSATNLTSTDVNSPEGPASALGDRANDLSMISSSMLGGIEVIKAITPDMDATMIGGVVNFDMRKAQKTSEPGGPSLIPRVEMRGQGSYNGLKDLRGDLRIVASAENRFMDNKFGVFVQASAEQRNLSDNELAVGYTLTDKNNGDVPLPDLTSMQMTDVFRTRKRLGGVLTLDYQHEGGEVDLMNFISSSKTRAVSRGEEILPVSTTDQIQYRAGETNSTLNVITNLLSIKQDIPVFHVDLKLSHSYSESHNPEDLFFNSTQHPAGFAGLPTMVKQPPSIIASVAQPDAGAASLDYMSTSGTFSRDRTLSGSLDLQTDLLVSEGLSSSIKFGGAWLHRARFYDFTQNDGSAWHEDVMIRAFTTAYPGLLLATRGANPTDISFLNFVYGGYSYGDFLNGQYSMPYPINVGMMWALLPVAKATPMFGDRGGYRPNLLASSINDYDGTEDKSAGYAMLKVNLGDQISILPGVRYQNLTTTYSAMRGILVPGNKIQGGDTTVTQSHGYWLPMVHVRYSPLDWMQLHFAYTNTLNYPDYSTLTPRYLVGTSYISYNNWRIRPAQSENFDLVVALHTNEIGLLSVNGFKKRIKDLVFYDRRYMTDLSAYPDLPQKTGLVYEFNTYFNNPVPADVYGIETEWQTHFWYLPGPLTGLVLSVNYTHIFSEASYPKTVINAAYDENGVLTETFTDTTYKSRLLHQPDDILNLILGYDLGGFSARVSVLYQNNIFKQPDFWMQNRVNSAKYTRWDFSVKQDLPWFGLQVFFNMNNITGENELNVNQKTGYPASEQRYGMSADLGFRIRL